MQTIRLTLLAAALFYVLPACFAQEFKLPKNEIEISNFKLGFSKHFNFTQGGTGITYRRMLTDRFGLQATGINNFIRYRNGDDITHYLEGNLGVSGIYFFKPSREGLYLSAGFQQGYMFDLTHRQSWWTTSSLTASFGGRTDLGKNFFLKGGIDVNYNLNYNNLDFRPNVGIGIRF